MERIDKKEFYNNIDNQILCEVRHIIALALNKGGLSQKNIATIVGVAPATICGWYKGTKTPSLKHYIALQYLKTILNILVRIRNGK